MELTWKGIKDRQAFENAGIELPGYDVEKVSRQTKAFPRWVHFGIGNIFRGFIGGIADDLLEAGMMDTGITCVETFDYEVVDKIYKTFDNLVLSIILRGDGTRQMKVLGSLGEAVKADSSDPASWSRLREIFAAPTLQLVSFTITEKGYALKGTDGSYLSYVEKDMENGPAQAKGAMAVLTAMLLERYQNGACPIALVSMDNCSHNGSLLRASVLTTAEEWVGRGLAEEGFLAYVSDPSKVSFPWTMIDKITPRPSEKIAEELNELGLPNMQPVITGKRTYIAPFVNAEGPQYLVIEDSFPGGRPDLSRGKGVYLADQKTVDLCERMKVTACLNPVHSALGPLGVVLGIDLFADLLKDPDILKMGRTVAYQEGMKVIKDPGILSPQAFTDELFDDRFPNEYLGDTNLRLCTDTSQGLGVRFGETIKAYRREYGTAEGLTAIPLGIAGYMRYLMGIDDQGQTYELAPDPLAGELHGRLSTVMLGDPDSLKDQLRPVLSNESIFFTDLYADGLGEKIEQMLKEMIAGPGAVKETIHRYMTNI
ncbi:MAG: mannitol dehydrogenase family protein [Firmicutes bacterium]|nr:mannitol dehydrogenase family protein [Bacillota bacterium]